MKKTTILRRVKNDEVGRENIPPHVTGLPLFQGSAPPSHSQPWLFRKNYQDYTKKMEKAMARLMGNNLVES